MRFRLAEPTWMILSDFMELYAFYTFEQLNYHAIEDLASLGNEEVRHLLACLERVHRQRAKLQCL